MKTTAYFLLTSMLLILGCKQEKKIDTATLFTALADSAQAISLLGDTLYPHSPYENVVRKFDSSRLAYEASPNDADKII